MTMTNEPTARNRASSGDAGDRGTGFPGLRVLSVPRIRQTVGTLKRVALAKLTDITMLSAPFGGEQYLFSPWLTALVDYGSGMTFVGAYRTDEDEADPRVPDICLRKSVWDRNLDLAQAPEDLRPYLAAGPQVANTFVFANGTTHPRLPEVMENALGVLSKGIAIVPEERQDVEWDWLSVEVADDRLICRLEYSPRVARSDSLEQVLLWWINEINGLMGDTGLSPDGEIRVSVRRSVPEMVDPDE